MRRLLLAALVLLAGCGGDAAGPYEPLDRSTAWAETMRVDGAPVLQFRVTRIRLSGTSWEVSASVRNLSKTAFAINPPRGVRGNNWTWFGVAPFPTAAVDSSRRPRILHAERYEPPLPQPLQPGQTWTGTFGGPGSPHRTGYLRVTFGMFEPQGPFPRRYSVFAWVTDHTLEL